MDVDLHWNAFNFYTFKVKTDDFNWTTAEPPLLFENISVTHHPLEKLEYLVLQVELQLLVD